MFVYLFNKIIDIILAIIGVLLNKKFNINTRKSRRKEKRVYFWLVIGIFFIILINNKIKRNSNPEPDSK